MKQIGLYNVSLLLCFQSTPKNRGAGNQRRENMYNVRTNALGDGTGMSESGKKKLSKTRMDGCSYERCWWWSKFAFFLGCFLVLAALTVVIVIIIFQLTVTCHHHHCYNCFFLAFLYIMENIMEYGMEVLCFFPHLLRSLHSTQLTQQNNILLLLSLPALLLPLPLQ